eukprot:CAMPEP_0116875586 /NCGR_PEP_ID=MMETSP0463-20121206/7598_1 /TAXON_ID=181622 /ORGANISM="Strombidinopsis sp, Strain SopsisLIS2011" /LENGTH=50 /DNA_ID=CAMNT_0004521479 /DNA_START=118 /DNA_END=270 /DNA_ORIENTATION=-
MDQDLTKHSDNVFAKESKAPKTAYKIKRNDSVPKILERDEIVNKNKYESS